MSLLIGFVYIVVLVTLFGSAVQRFVPVPQGLGKRLAIVAGISFGATALSMAAQDLVKCLFKVVLSNTWPYFATLATSMLYLSKMNAVDRERRRGA